MHTDDNEFPSANRRARRAANRRLRHATREAIAWHYVKQSMLCNGIEFEPHELSLANLADQLQAARRKLTAAAPMAAALVDIEFGKLEDAVAELPSQRSMAPESD